jgi:hypothetical protein
VKVLYETIFNALNDAKVRYLVVGGVAVTLHGIQRLTVDLDLAIALDEANILNTVKVLQRLGFVPRLPLKAEDLANNEKRKEWREQKAMLAFSFFRREREFETIDIITDFPLDFEQCYVRRVQLDRENISIPLMDIPDLINMKQHANRKQDMSDIEFLKKVLDRREKH